MAIKSLNKAYEQNSIKYVCNSCGDVFDPDDYYRCITDDCEMRKILTEHELDLFTHYWGPDYDQYVLRVAEPGMPMEAAIGLNFLVDAGWCRDIMARRNPKAGKIPMEEVKDRYMPRMLRAMRDAVEVTLGDLVPGCDFYIGDNTDPDGHELLMVVPYEMRDHIYEIIKKLENKLYEEIELLFLAELQK